MAASALAEAGVELEDRALAGRALRRRLEAAGQPPGRAEVVAEGLLDLALPGSGPAAGHAANVDRSILFGAWLDGLESLVAGRTAVWLVEDIHWASPDILAFLDELIGRPAPDGRLTVATARPGFIDSAPGWAAVDPAAGVHRLELPTLPSSDALGLIDELVGDALPADLARRIVDASDGNCLFIEELLRTWIGSGALVAIELPTDGKPGGGNGRWQLTIPAREIALPTSVQAIYAAQLDDLPASSRQAARRGAVAGRRCPIEALRSLGVADPTGVVEELKRRALVDGPRVDPDLGDTFSYRHALLRDAGYASLGRAERADLHVRFAHWLEDRARESDRTAGTIGDHLAMALASAPALAAEVADGLGRDACAEQAATWLERAGRHALGEGAPEAAADLFRRSAALTLPGAPVDASRRWTQLGLLLTSIGGLAEAGEAFAGAIDAARLARRQGDSSWRSLFARAAEGRSALLYEQLRFVAAWHQGEADLAELGEGEDLDTARLRLATSRARSGETNDAGPWVDDAQRALEAARREGDQDVVLAAARELARARSEAGLGGIEEWIELGVLAHQRGDAALEVSARTMETSWVMAAAPTAVPEILRPARELAVARGLVERLAWLEHAEAEAALGAGDWTRAISAGMEAIELGERHGYDRVTVRTWATVLPIASLRAETEILDRASAWFDARSGGLPDSPYGRVLLAGCRQWLAEAGRGREPLPEVDVLRPSFPQWLTNGSYEWLAASEAVLDGWFRTGHRDWCAEALEPAGGDLPADLFRPALFAFRLDLLRLVVPGASRTALASAESGARSAIGELRLIGLPLWVARGIRVLEELGVATTDDVSERTELEARLGVVRPTL